MLSGCSLVSRETLSFMWESCTEEYLVFLVFQEPIVERHERKHLEACYLLVIRTERKLCNQTKLTRVSARKQGCVHSLHLTGLHKWYLAPLMILPPPGNSPPCLEFCLTAWMKRVIIHVWGGSIVALLFRYFMMQRILFNVFSFRLFYAEFAYWFFFLQFETNSADLQVCWCAFVGGLCYGEERHSSVFCFQKWYWCKLWLWFKQSQTWASQTLGHRQKLSYTFLIWKTKAHTKKKKKKRKGEKTK